VSLPASESSAQVVDEEVTIQWRVLKGVFLAAILVIGLVATAGRARGDAIFVTNAMKASTIAEISIDRKAVRVELEIASSDMEVFQDILPDKLFAALGKRSQFWINFVWDMRKLGIVGVTGCCIDDLARA
jgi:hypothetical protein